MIKISSNTIMVLQKDSSLEPFEASEISSGIVGACLRSGESSTWIGEDIARSVEFALLSREKHLLSIRELNDMIIRSLEDSGYPKVAEEYSRKNAPAVTDSVSVSREKIKEILAENLALGRERCEYLAEKVEKSLCILGFSSVSQRLIQELARQYRDADGVFPPGLVQHTRKTKHFDSVLLSKGELLELLPEDVRSYFEKKILAFHDVSVLFPVLRFDLSLSLFSDCAELRPPVTELAFWSSSSGLAHALDEAVAKAEKAVLEKLRISGEPDPETLPFSIDVTDTLTFAAGYMNCPERYASEYVPQLLGPFAAALKKQPFKITCL